MSSYRKIEIYEPSPSLFIRDTSIFNPSFPTFPSFSLQQEDLGFAIDFINPNPCYQLSSTLPRQCLVSRTPSLTTPPDFFDTVTDLIEIEKAPFHSSYKRIHQRRSEGTDLCLRRLCDRVSALETGLNQISKSKKIKNILDRKYSWSREIKSHDKTGIDRKYKWITEIKGGKKKEISEDFDEKKFKFIAKIKGKGEEDFLAERKYIFKTSINPGKESCKSTKKLDKKKESSSSDEKKKKKKDCYSTRVVEIEEPVDHRVVVLRQAFARKFAASNSRKGKKKDLSPQDAAIIIQMTFRAYLIRRSQTLRALRALAMAKAKLKELRVLFNNFAYRHCLTHDAEERQKLSEKIIVLLLTIDGIEGTDIMVRAAKRSMVNELESMLDVVDPQLPGMSGSMKRRRRFNLPEGSFQKEIEVGVAEILQMLNQD